MPATEPAPATEAPRADRLLRLSQVTEMTGLGKTMIYRLIKEGRFPQQFKPGGHASRWSEEEVRAWREEQRQRGLGGQS